MNKNDLRWLRTEQKIKQALIAELKQKSFAHLRIVDLIARAAISRRAFYLHYEDKFDLLTKQEMQLLEQLQVCLQNSHNLFKKEPNHDQYALTHTVFEETLSFIDRERSLFKVLLSSNGDPHFNQQLRTMLENEIDFRTKLYHAHTTKLIPARYVKEIMVGLLFDLINSWISNPHPESPQKFAKILTLSRLTAPMELLIIEK